MKKSTCAYLGFMALCILLFFAPDLKTLVNKDAIFVKNASYEEASAGDYTALEIIEKTAKYGYGGPINQSNAQFDLGRLYANGGIVPQNKEKALYWYHRAAEQGNIDAQLALSKELSQPGQAIYSNQIILRHNASTDTDATALGNTLYEKASAGDRTALGLIEEKAKDEDPIAQFNLGKLYASGPMVPQNKETALYWYRKAAEQGNIDAQLALGKELSQPEQAAYWLQKILNSGKNAEASRELGMLYMTGEGVTYNPTKGAQLLHDAIAQKDSKAEKQLQKLYESDIFRLKDKPWFLERAERDDHIAQYVLGHFYNCENSFFRCDRDKAFYWLNKASAGVPDAAKELKETKLKRYSLFIYIFIGLGAIFLVIYISKDQILDENDLR